MDSSSPVLLAIAKDLAIEAVRDAPAPDPKGRTRTELVTAAFRHFVEEVAAARRDMEKDRK